MILMEWRFCMLSLKYVKEHLDEIEQDKFLDMRWTKRFLSFLPTNEWDDCGFIYNGNETIEVKDWTEENVLKQLKDDTEFAIEKATNHRGISAGLMNCVLQSWCIVLENGLENTDYGWYGDKLIKAVDKLYNFGLVTENTFDEDFYKNW